MASPRQCFILFTIRTGAVLPFTRYGEPIDIPIADLVPVYYLELQLPDVDIEQEYSLPRLLYECKDIDFLSLPGISRKQQACARDMEQLTLQ